MSGANNRTRFLAAAMETVGGLNLTGWSSAVRAAPLLPSGLNLPDLAQHRLLF
jgi:hypothetical protein